MPVPSHLTDQELSYIESRGFNFRDFSAEQVQDELASNGIKSAGDYFNFQKKPEPPSIESGVEYSHVSAEMYKKMGYALKRSTSIAGGWIYAK